MVVDLFYASLQVFSVLDALLTEIQQGTYLSFCDHKRATEYVVRRLQGELGPEYGA